MTNLNLKTLLAADKLATHNGPFHGDDVVAMALLRVLGWTGEVVRTRDAAVLQSLVGIDVAGSASGEMFDHHGPAAEPGVCALTKLWKWIRPQLEDASFAERLDKLLGADFAAVAAVDSGAVSDPAQANNMFAWVRFAAAQGCSDEDFDAAVGRAVPILLDVMASAKEWATTLAEARAAVTWDGTPPILDVERRGTKEALHSLGCEAPFFVSPHGEGEWAVVQTCPAGEPFSPFGCSGYLPSAWAGLRGEELAKVSGYASARFAFAPDRKNVVMAFFASKEDAIAAAESACLCPEAKR